MAYNIDNETSKGDYEMATKIKGRKYHYYNHYRWCSFNIVHHFKCTKILIDAFISPRDGYINIEEISLPLNYYSDKEIEEIAQKAIRGIINIDD